MSIELVFLVLYFAAMLGIGVWAARRKSATTEGFLLADRSLGPAVTALRLQSSSMSGYMFLGAGSLGYSQGYFGMWYALGDVGGGVLNLSILGRRMRKLSAMLGSITSIGYLEHRYPSPWTRAIAAAVALFCMFFYVLAQFLAGGQGLAMVTGLSVDVSMIIAVSVIIGYTFLGGYLAVAYTDFVQAIVMVIGMLWILVATLQYVGGLTAGHEQLAAVDADLLTMWGVDQQYLGEWGVIIGAVLIFSIGYMGWPHVNVSHMAMRQPSVARRAGLYATGFNLAFIPAAYLIGMMALVIVPNLDNPELAIFEVAATVLPSFALGIVMAAIMAAIMSTADALLLQAGTIASHDLWGRFRKGAVDERSSVNVSRITVLVLGVIGVVLAITEPPGVFSIVVFATSVLGAAFVPVYVCAVWWKKANTPGALASIVVGTVAAVTAQLTGSSDSIGFDPMGIGITCSVIAIVVVSLLTQRSSPVPEHVLVAVEEAARVRPVPARLAAGEDPTLASQLPDLDRR
ncbi:sodium/proline symporter [Ornithinimicrobium pekingense]|uniref:Sodium/proline symporter n=1 Tax=Ornithinimicrobium pekingense TaxID=384677 RepID=A0ABQ2FED7_9MICO|nr:sodium/proline symporter [Ornithinimicrobium pekingense]GGK79650.1 sodium:proline symporter [Ornithinimicrobium pekingense]